MKDALVIFPLAVVLSTGLPAAPSAHAQTSVAGRVIDKTGRSLPFAVVTSRTRNGFLSAWTDLDGRFDFAGRSHRAGDIIEVRSSGYGPHTVRLTDSTAEMTVTMDSTGFVRGTGWGIGLPTTVALEVLLADSSALDHPDFLIAGETYRLRVVIRGRDSCIRSGPSAYSVNGTRVTVAVAVFSRNRDCRDDLIEVEEFIDIDVGRPGVGSIRLVGRYDDTVVPISVRRR